MGQFRDFIDIREFAEFGFGSNITKNTMGGTVPSKGDIPIDVIHSSKIIAELVSNGNIGNLQLNHKFQDLLEYGSDVGALQLQLTPLGSYKIVVRRKVISVTGEHKWVCKKVFPLNEGEHNTKEEAYASEIHEYLQSLNDQNLDSPNVDYQDFNKLSLKLFANVRRVFPSYCMFPIGMYKKNENYHKYVFEFRGHGVEAPTGSRAEQFDIDLVYYPKQGMLRCWGYDIDSSKRQHSWKVQPSEWDEWFTPTQHKDEIIESISRTFMTY